MPNLYPPFSILTWVSADQPRLYGPCDYIFTRAKYKGAEGHKTSFQGKEGRKSSVHEI